MEAGSNPPNAKYQPVTVDVPEDRVAEFHAFFARFLAGRSGRGPRGRHGGPHGRLHGRHCAPRRGAAARGDAMPEGPETTEV